MKKDFEVIVPRVEDGIGQFDQSVLLANINNVNANDTPPDEDEDGFELLNVVC